MANTNQTDFGDDIYLVVKRTIDGSVVRYIEQLSSRFLQYTPNPEQAFFVDSGITFSNPKAITAITKADPGVVTATAHGFSNGDLVDIRDIFEGMVELLQDDDGNALPYKRYKVANKGTNTFELNTVDDEDVDTTGFTAYTTGGNATEAITALTGLDHLEDADVAILANGFIVDGLTVASGEVTLPEAASIIHVGLPFKSELITLNLEAQTAAGTIQDKVRSIGSAMVRLENTNALWIGVDESKAEQVNFRTDEVFGQPTRLLTGDKIQNFLAGDGSEAKIYIKNEDPLPMTVLGIIPRVSIGGI